MSRYIDAEKLKAEGWHLVRERSNRWQAYIEGMDLDLVPTAETKTVYYWHEDLQRRGRPHKVIEVEDE